MADENNIEPLPKLTDKQQRFIDAYFNCNLNATKAAKLAGYSDKTARQMGTENLSKPVIRTEIDRRMAEMAMPPGEVIARLSQHASSSMEDFIKRDGNLAFLDLEKAEQANQLHLIKKFKITKRGIEVELHDSQAALVHLGRHYGLFTDKLEHSGTLTWEQVIQKAKETQESDGSNPFA